MALYVLQVPPNRTYTYDADNDILQIQKKDIMSFSDNQRILQMVNLAAQRVHAPANERPLYTAFMLRIALTWPTYDSVVFNVARIHHTRRELRAEVSKACIDALRLGIKPMFLPTSEIEVKGERPGASAVTLTSNPVWRTEIEDGRYVPIVVVPQIQHTSAAAPADSTTDTPCATEPRSRKRVIRSPTPEPNDDEIGQTLPLKAKLMCVDLESLKTRVKKLKHEREELEDVFKDLRKLQQEKLLSEAEELERINVELRARIVALGGPDEEE